MIGDLYETTQSFVSNVARSIASRSDGVMFSAYGYSDFHELISDSTSDVEEFAAKVKRPTALGGTANIYSGMKACLDTLMGVRGNRVIVLIAANKDNGMPRAEDLVPEIKSNGVSVVSLGTGMANQRYLTSLSSKSDYFIHTTKKTFLRKSTAVVKRTCAAVEDEKDVCQAAYDACDFKFSGMKKVPVYNLTGATDVTFSDAIEKRSGEDRIGVLNMNGVVPEFIRPDGTILPINRVGAPPFAPTTFKPFFIISSYRSALGHQAFQGTQVSLARDRCVRVYFTMYQTLSKGWPPIVANNVNVQKEDNKCVVFKTC